MQHVGYRSLEHTSDAYLEAWGSSLEEAFENAAKALFDTMVELEKVEAVEEDSFEVEGEDLESLLYNWLESLLIEFDSRGMVYREFDVRIERRDGGFRLSARARGERFDLEKHGYKVGVKAVTYHLMKVEADDTYRVRFLLDI